MTKKEYEKSLCKYPTALTVAEVSEILRVSTKTVYKLIKEKNLPAVKVGRENRIAKSHLINYLRQIDNRDSNPKVYLIEKTQNNVWTCKPSCDIVCVGAEPKIKKGVIINGNTKYTCGKRAT